MSCQRLAEVFGGAVLEAGKAQVGYGGAGQLPPAYAVELDGGAFDGRLAQCGPSAGRGWSG